MRDRFVFVSTEQGTQWRAYLAGPVWWYECHRCPQSKPCVARFTNGELQCATCRSGSEPYWWGYVPLYRETDHRPVLVGVREHQSEPTSKIPRCASVLIARPDDKFEGVTVSLLKSGEYRTSRADRQRAPELLPDLLRLWKLPALTEWCASRSVALGAGAGDIPLSPEPPGPPETPAAASCPRLPAGRVGDASLANEEYAALTRRVKSKIESIERNGKHQQPPDGT